MRIREGSLTPRERVFVERFAATSDAIYAAEKAGYANVPAAASTLPGKPRVAKALSTARERLIDVGALTGVNTLIDLCDPKIPPGVRRAAASDLCKYAAIGDLDDNARKELHEMTLEELERRRQELMSERANHAKVIELEPGDNAQPAPNDEPEPSIFG